MHPVLRHLRDELSATAVRILAYFGGIAVIAVTVFWIFGIPVIKAASELAMGAATQRTPNTPRLDWIDAPRDPKLRGRIAAK